MERFLFSRQTLEILTFRYPRAGAPRAWNGFCRPGCHLGDLEQIRLNPGHILQPRSSVGIPAA